jgi:hypothetical protein
MTLRRRLSVPAVAVITLAALASQPAVAQDDDGLLPIPPDAFEPGLLPVPGDEPPDPLAPLPEPEGEPPTVPDGDYVGAWGLGGSWWLGTGQFTLIWTGEASGPIDFTVVDDALEGTWSMEGAAITDTRGLPVESEGSSRWSAAGTISGSGPYTTDGSGSGTSSATVVVPGLGPQTRTDNYSFSGAGQLDHLLVVCGQVNGSWQQRFDEAFAGSGIQHSITTYLSAIQIDSDDPLDTEVAELTELVAEANLVQPDFSNPGPSFSRLTAIVAQAETLIADLGFDFTECDPSEKFMRIITGRVQDILNTYLVDWLAQGPGIDLADFRQAITLGLRSGAIGGGGPDPAGSLFLQFQAEDIIQREFDEAVGDDLLGTSGGDPDRVIEVVLVAEQLGMTLDDPAFTSEVTAPDICLALGLEVSAC